MKWIQSEQIEFPSAENIIVRFNRCTFVREVWVYNDAKNCTMVIGWMAEIQAVHENLWRHFQCDIASRLGWICNKNRNWL